MRRRTFLTRAAMGMTAFASGVLPALGAEKQAAGETDSAAASPAANATPSVGRPVRIVSIGFQGTGMPLERIVKHVDEEGARGADVIALPETCRGQNASSEEPLHGPTVTAMAELAARHRTYIAVPIDRRDQQKRLNTVVLLDRMGHLVCHYDKVFPYWSEYTVTPPVSPGDATEVFRGGFRPHGICNLLRCQFSRSMEALVGAAGRGRHMAERVFRRHSLQAHAINHHYYIVTASATPDCIVHDITGERIFYEFAKDMNVSRVTLDLDRCIFHENFNLEKRDKLLKEHGQDLVQEKWMKLEQWFVLKAKRPGVSARALAGQYGLEESGITLSAAGWRSTNFVVGNFPP